MPFDEEAAAAPADPQLQAQGDAEAQQQEQLINNAAPEATEPLQANRLTALSQAMTTAAEALSGQQVNAEPMEFTEDQPQIPPEMFAQISAFAAIAGSVPEAEQYAFDPSEFSADNAGLAEVMGLIGGMSRDKTVARAIARGPETAPEEEAAPAAPAGPEKGSDPDMDRFIA